MWTLSGFGDEIDPDPDAQCALLTGVGVRHIEVRSAWDVNVLDLDDDQVATLRATVRRHGMAVSSIGSPIGKIPVTGDFEAHLSRFARALAVAEALEAPYLRIFSFYVSGDLRRHRDTVVRRLAALARRTPRDLTLVLENERGLYGDVPERCRDLVESVGSDRLRLAFDGGNFVFCDVRPFREAYPLLREHIGYVQVKDAVAATGRCCLPGTGDAEWPETVRALRTDGFDGFFSMEPHLTVAGPRGGFSGPERFAAATRAFTDLLTAAHIDHR